MFFWTIGNLCNLWLSLHSLKRIKKEKGFILTRINEDPSKKEFFKDQMKKLSDDTKMYTRLLLKSFGDLITSSSGAGIIQKFGITPNNGVIGLCGLLSSTIATWEAYKKATK